MLRPVDGGLPRSARSRRDSERVAAIVDYYGCATQDYRRWSAALHMHFGYWRWPLSPFDREAMIAALSQTVHERLGLAVDAEGTILDLGCGVGSAARQLASRHPRVQLLGLTLAPTQVDLGTELTLRAGLGDRVELIRADYRDVPRTGAAAIGAYAIESACYDPDGGAGLIREAARVIEPGARLVVADAFLRRALPQAAEPFERGMSEGWVLPGLNGLARFVELLAIHGFEAIEVEDVSLRVLPTVLQIPLVALVHRVVEGAGLRDARRRGHLRASLWCLLSALLWPRRFGYFIITARRAP